MGRDDYQFGVAEWEFDCAESLNLAHCCQANTFGYSRGRQILECDCGGEYRKRLEGSYFPEDTGRLTGLSGFEDLDV
ncbi:hypothetical protein Pyn_24980 [Prunus yedoensis var. nudiflora]|uniref:Uncharacterized protein n=1 Tax=Prunus yedoensis var. nudiflora TaxID=2094558 RepID=A0A314YYF5_PRUYE|nr:hypothetical protein Pyn_24980 [Prunus yedoensis var. nudiflora]